MKTSEKIAALMKEVRAMVASRTTPELVEIIERLNELPRREDTLTARKWVIDELIRRDQSAAYAWLDSDDESPRRYFLKD